MQKIDSKIAFFDHYRSRFAEQDWALQMDNFEEELKSLFSGAKEDETDPSLWWVISMTGGTIVLTLSYVGWRKYKGDKKEARRKKRNR
jgi:sporulation protein YpjB